VLPLVSIMTCLFGPDGFLESASRANGIVVTVRPQKMSYIRNEPIAIEIMLENKSRHDAHFSAIGLPLRDIDYQFALTFDPLKTKLRVAPLPDVVSLRMSRCVLRKGATVKDVIYLQMFMVPFEIGQYEIVTSFHHRAALGEKSVLMYGACTLKFKIIPDDRKTRVSVASGYLDAYRYAKTDSEEYRAGQAMVMMKDGEILPFFVRALIHQQSVKAKFERLRRNPISVGLIESLSSNRSAIAVVNESLEAKQNPPMSDLEILTVLTIWKCRVPDEMLKRFRESRDPTIREKLREYLQKQHDAAKNAD
jgi:hypothetical protein